MAACVLSGAACLTPVAMVVAEDRYIAEDAAELVAVDYSPLPAVTSIEQSLDPNAPRLFEGWASNRLLDLAVADPAVTCAVAQRPAVLPLQAAGYRSRTGARLPLLDTSPAQAQRMIVRLCNALDRSTRTAFFIRIMVGRPSSIFRTCS